jgi:RHS repeat-associated protein
VVVLPDFEETRHYLGGLEFVDGEPESYNFGDGRIVYSDSVPPRPQFRLHDHLGNTVVFFEDKNNDGCITTEADTNDPDSLEVIQRFWYYPFGMAMQGLRDWATEPGQWYRYNGKERDTVSGWYEYGARWYIDEIGRFAGVDPIADQMPGWSPYSYGFDNPISFNDPTGMKPEGPAWIYDQQKDGSYKRREGVKNDGGESFHTYHNNDGTVSYFNQKENTFVTVNKQEINEKAKNLNPTMVHQIGLTAAVGAPLGLTVSGGIAWDSKGNINPYGSIGFFHGLEITAGIEYTQTRSNKNNPDFSIYSLTGSAVNYNFGLHVFDGGWGE